jgi:hypothetical protein
MKLKSIVRHGVPALVGAGLVVLASNLQASFVPLNGTNYVQSFDSLPTKGQSTQLPQGWSFVEFGPGNNKIKADDGHSAAGGIYSYGDKHSDDRALGILVGNNGSSGIFGAAFENSGSGPINRLDISFTGEEWRLGQAGKQNQLQFQYSLNAQSLTSGNWFNVPQLDFFTPNVTGVGAHDGNLAANQRQLSGSISFLNIPSGGNFWVRWVEAAPPGGGPGDGLAVDNFSISTVPEVSTYLGGLAACGLLFFALRPHLRSSSSRR